MAVTTRATSSIAPHRTHPARRAENRHWTQVQIPATWPRSCRWTQVPIPATWPRSCRQSARHLLRYAEEWVARAAAGATTNRTSGLSFAGQMPGNDRNGRWGRVLRTASGQSGLLAAFAVACRVGVCDRSIEGPASPQHPARLCPGLPSASYAVFGLKTPEYPFHLGQSLPRILRISRDIECGEQTRYARMSRSLALHRPSTAYRACLAGSWCMSRSNQSSRR